MVCVLLPITAFTPPTPTRPHAHSEKDLDEVLQTETIFSNVGKGVLAKQEDLLEVFGTADERAICLKILAEGDLQVSDKERRVELDALFRDVAFLLSEKCVNPTNSRPYTASMLERALRDAHFAVDPNKKAKQQLPEVGEKVYAHSYCTGRKQHENNISSQCTSSGIVITPAAAAHSTGTHAPAGHSRRSLTG